MSTIFHCSDPEATRAAALRLARGSYQRSLILGGESWNGSSLRGRAKDWSSRYHASRVTLQARLAGWIRLKGPDLHVIDVPWCLAEGLRGLAALGAPIGGPELTGIEIGTECLARGLVTIASWVSPTQV